MDDRDRDGSSLEAERHELGEAMRRQLDADVLEAPRSVGAVMTKGRRLKRRRRLFASGGVAAATCVAVLLVPFIGGLGSNDDDGRVAQESSVPIDRVATFALRAAAEAGQMNTRGDYLRYEGVTTTDEGWEVSFGSSTCYEKDGLETCEPNTNEPGSREALEDTYFDIGLADGEPRILDARGPTIDERTLARLRAAAGTTDPIPPHPEIAPFELYEPNESEGGSGVLAYTLTSYWAGPIPGNVMTFACYVRGFNADGDLVYEDTSAFAFESPQSEEERSGGFMSSGFPAETGARTADMVCDRFTGPGWEQDGPLTVKQHPTGRSVEVRGDAVWRDRSVVGTEVDCLVELHAADGSVVGDKSFPMSAPWKPRSSAPYHEDIFWIIDVPGGAAVESASFSCSFPSPPVKEPEGDEADEDGNGGAPDDTPPTERPNPPEGPREALMSGTFEGAAEWGDYDGRSWRLATWSDELFHCYAFEVEPYDDYGQMNRMCGDRSESMVDPLGGSGYMPAAMFNGETSITYGQVRDDVIRVEITLSNGQKTSVETVPDPTTGISFYVAFLEPSETITVAAYNEAGERIQQQEMRND